MRRRKRRKWLYWMGVPIVLGLAFLYGLYALLRPAPMARTEIYKGVYLTVEDYPGDGPVRGRVMIVEVHWDTPGVELVHRKFSRLSMATRSASQFRTIPADLALSGEAAEVLINTTLFEPDSLVSFIPGKGVRSLDTLVVDGQVSHIHEHSYLLYWDRNDKVHMANHKPPSKEDLDQAVLGIGIQGIGVNGGLPRTQVTGNVGHEGELTARSFIGVDPERKILWLLACEQSTEQFMARRAAEAGVIVGGQMDGGSSTNLLIGKRAANLRSHTGIRNLRPLGPYLTVQADPL